MDQLPCDVQRCIFLHVGYKLELRCVSHATRHVVEEMLAPKILWTQYMVQQVFNVWKTMHCPFKPNDLVCYYGRTYRILNVKKDTLSHDSITYVQFDSRDTLVQYFHVPWKQLIKSNPMFHPQCICFDVMYAVDRVCCEVHRHLGFEFILRELRRRLPPGFVEDIIKYACRHYNVQNL